MPLSARLRASPYTVASIGLLLVVAYLCLVNLDYAALWHDEAPAAFFGKTLLQQGDIVGWDGRNLVGGTNNQEARCVHLAPQRIVSLLIPGIEAPRGRVPRVPQSRIFCLSSLMYVRMT